MSATPDAQAETPHEEDDVLTNLSKKWRETARQQDALIASGDSLNPNAMSVMAEMNELHADDLDAAFAVSPVVTTTSGIVLTVPEYNRLRAIDAGEFEAGYYPYGHPERCLLHEGEWACHKRTRHPGACSTHNDCGEMKDGTACGFRPQHEGRHAWEASAASWKEKTPAICGHYISELACQLPEDHDGNCSAYLPQAKEPR